VFLLVLYANYILTIKNRSSHNPIEKISDVEFDADIDSDSNFPLCPDSNKRCRRQGTFGTVSRIRLYFKASLVYIIIFLQSYSCTTGSHLPLPPTDRQTTSFISNKHSAVSWALRLQRIALQGPIPVLGPLLQGLGAVI
jgi:hypothetical protein